MRERHPHRQPLVLGGILLLASLAKPMPALANTTPIATFVPVPYTNFSEPFNHRIEEFATPGDRDGQSDEDGQDDGPGGGRDAGNAGPSGAGDGDSIRYTEHEFLVSGNANIYKKDAVTGNAVVNTPNHPFTSRILVRLPADPRKFSGNAVMEIYNGTPGYDADVEWTQVKGLLQRRGDAWIGLTNGTGPVNVLKNDYAPKHAPGRYDALNFTSAALVWDLISQTGALIKSNKTTRLLPGYKIKHVFAMAESGAAQTLVLYINDIHPFWRMPDGGPIFDGFMPDERFGTGASLAPGVAAWPTCSPRLVLHSDVPVMNLETQPDLLSSQAWCVRRPDSDTPGDRFRSWELPGSPHLTPFVTDDDNSHRDLDGTPFVYSTFTCTHETAVSRFPKEYFKQAALGALYDWVENDTPPPSAPPIALRLPTPPALTPVSYILDGDGNETGGLRTPFVDFPDREWIVNDTTVTSTGPLGALFCTLYGYTIPLLHGELKALYRNHSDYVNRVAHETDHLVKEHFLQKWNADTIKNDAAHADVP
jgi:hypothetical protein